MKRKNAHKSLSGQQIGNLYVIKEVDEPSQVTTSKKRHWYLCKCICGNEKVIRSDQIKIPNKSCGCIRKPQPKGYKHTKPRKCKSPEEKVPKSLHRLRSIWSKMKRRCYDERDDQYKNYGAKGIYICDKWLEFKGFKEDMYESYLEFEKINGENTATIDRIDNSKPYELSNCRWATQLQQARNRSNNIKVELEGIIYSAISEVSEAYGVNYGTVLGRYNRGIRGLDLVDKSNIKHTNSVGTYFGNRKHYEKMKKRRENKNQGS